MLPLTLFPACAVALPLTLQQASREGGATFDAAASNTTSLPGVTQLNFTLLGGGLVTGCMLLHVLGCTHKWPCQVVSIKCSRSVWQHGRRVVVRAEEHDAGRAWLHTPSGSRHETHECSRQSCGSMALTQCGVVCREQHVYRRATAAAAVLGMMLTLLTGTFFATGNGFQAQAHSVHIALLFPCMVVDCSSCLLTLQQMFTL